MHKLVILIEELANQEQFDQMWPEFLHLSESMPGLIKEATCRVDSTLYGSYQPYLLHELYFESMDAIQQAMGWENRHLHEFRHGKGRRLMDVIGPDHPDPPRGDCFQDETKVTLKEFVGRRHFPVRLLYRYDFGDDWIHEIAIEGRTTGGGDGLPILLEGERACPPEDCGGPPMYLACLKGDLEWLDDSYNPERFEPQKVRFRHPRRKR